MWEMGILLIPVAASGRILPFPQLSVSLYITGGGFIGVGEPSGHQFQGHYLQLADMLGVEKETGFTLNYDKYNWEEHPDHFILADTTKPVDFGEVKRTSSLTRTRKFWYSGRRKLQMAVHEFGKGAVFISAVCRTALRTAVCFTAQCSGPHLQRKS